MFVRLVQWLKDYFPEIANAVGAILLASGGLAGLSPWNEGIKQFALSLPGAVFLFGAALILAGTIASTRRSRAMRPLRERLERFEGVLEQMAGVHYDLCSTTLARISRDTLGYGYTERISVYRHRGERAFQLMGRYSENPEFARRGRPIYPANQGVIGRA